MEIYESGLKLYKKRKLRFFKGNLNVRKWRTNHGKLHQVIEIQENDAVNTEIGNKVLGIKWDEEGRCIDNGL